MQRSTDSIVALIVSADGCSGQEREWQASLVPVAHLPVIVHAIRALEEAGATQILVDVDGDDQGEEMAASIRSSGARVHFGNPGTVRTKSLQLLEPEPGTRAGHVLVTFGVRPLLRGATLRQLVNSARESGGVALLYPTGSEGGNSPIAACLPGSELADAVARETGGSKGETSGTISFLLDTVKDGSGECAASNCTPDEAMPVRTSADCQPVEACFQSRARNSAASNGVIMHGPETVWFSHDTVVEPGVVLEPVIVFGPGVTVRDGATIRAFSHLEGCVIERGAVVGPHARLRPGTTVSEGARVGNFVEIKASAIGAGTKVSHLSYIGDSQVEDGANVGAGTITCNFDGVSKHRTVIGERAFVGSHSTLVAPVRVGAGAMTAAGTVVTKDVPDDALAIGRTEQRNKPGMARQLMARLSLLARKRR